jgi:hypothetical protein
MGCASSSPVDAAAEARSKEIDKALKEVGGVGVVASLDGFESRGSTVDGRGLGIEGQWQVDSVSGGAVTLGIPISSMNLEETCERIGHG